MIIYMHVYIIRNATSFNAAIECCPYFFGLQIMIIVGPEKFGWIWNIMHSLKMTHQLTKHWVQANCWAEHSFWGCYSSLQKPYDVRPTTSWLPEQNLDRETASQTSDCKLTKHNGLLNRSIGRYSLELIHGVRATSYVEDRRELQLSRWKTQNVPLQQLLQYVVLRPDGGGFHGQAE